MPAPPTETINAPVAIEVAFVALLNVLTPDKVFVPFSVEEPIVFVPDNVVFFATDKLPPTFTFAVIPAPPDTTNAPVVALVDCVVFPTITNPEMVLFPKITALPPTYKLLLIPAPPDTNNAPVVALVDCVMLFTFIVPVIKIPPVTPNPPFTCNEPVDTLVETSVDLIITFPLTVFVPNELPNDKLLPVWGLITFVYKFPLTATFPLTSNVCVLVDFPTETLPEL